MRFRNYLSIIPICAVTPAALLLGGCGSDPPAAPTVSPPGTEAAPVWGGRQHGAPERKPDQLDPRRMKEKKSRRPDRHRDDGHRSPRGESRHGPAGSRRDDGLISQVDRVRVRGTGKAPDGHSAPAPPALVGTGGSSLRHTEARGEPPEVRADSRPASPVLQPAHQASTVVVAQPGFTADANMWTSFPIAPPRSPVRIGTPVGSHQPPPPPPAPSSAVPGQTQVLRRESSSGVAPGGDDSGHLSGPPPPWLAPASDPATGPTDAALWWEPLPQPPTPSIAAQPGPIGVTSQHGPEAAGSSDPYAVLTQQAQDVHHDSHPVDPSDPYRFVGVDPVPPPSRPLYDPSPNGSAEDPHAPPPSDGQSRQAGRRHHHASGTVFGGNEGVADLVGNVASGFANNPMDSSAMSDLGEAVVAIFGLILGGWAM